MIVWVGTVPAKASGAGLLLLYASSYASVAPAPQTGPLLPIDMLAPRRGARRPDATIDGWLAARGRDRRPLARGRGDARGRRPSTLRVRRVGVARRCLELLTSLDGQEVPTAGGPVVLQTRIATTDAEVQAGEGVSIRFNEPGPIERLLHAVASPSMVYFLLVFGLACLAFELTQPGFGFAGFAGVGLLALAGYGIWVVPPSWVGARARPRRHRAARAPTSVCGGWACSPAAGVVAVRRRVVPRCTRGWPTRSGSRRG